MAKSRDNRSSKQRVSGGKEIQKNLAGARTSGNVGAKVSDGAGTRSRATLPPETLGMKAPKVGLPPEATAIASKTMEVPSSDTPLITIEPWDYSRDTKLGRDKRPSGGG